MTTDTTPHTQSGMKVTVIGTATQTVADTAIANNWSLLPRASVMQHRWTRSDGSVLAVNYTTSGTVKSAIAYTADEYAALNTTPAVAVLPVPGREIAWGGKYAKKDRLGTVLAHLKGTAA